MMPTYCQSRRAFSLIELIATLVLGGILASGGAALIVYVAQGYNTVQQHAALAQSAELALGRLVREARHADFIGGGGSSVTFTRGGIARVFGLTGDTLGVQRGGVTYPLMRNVAGFTVERIVFGNAELVRFTLTPTGGGPDFMTGHLVAPNEE